ncbi:MAG: hypothetical protein KKA60_07235 [Proteobacteria bacterium]|nr:hypothetical protein [Pseudomonadota bacterium]
MKSPAILAIALILCLFPAGPVALAAENAQAPCSDVRQALAEARAWYEANEDSLSDAARFTWARHVEELESMARDCRPNGPWRITRQRVREDRCAHLRTEIARAEAHFLRNEKNLSDAARFAWTQKVGRMRQDLAACSSVPAAPARSGKTGCERLTTALEEARKLRALEANPARSLQLNHHVESLERALAECRGQ